MLGFATLPHSAGSCMRAAAADGALQRQRHRLGVSLARRRVTIMVVELRLPASSRRSSGRAGAPCSNRSRPPRRIGSFAQRPRLCRCGGFHRRGGRLHDRRAWGRRAGGCAWQPHLRSMSRRAHAGERARAQPWRTRGGRSKGFAFFGALGRRARRLAAALSAGANARHRAVTALGLTPAEHRGARSMRARAAPTVIRSRFVHGGCGYRALRCADARMGNALRPRPISWAPAASAPDLARRAACARPIGTTRISSRHAAVVAVVDHAVLCALFDGSPERPRQEARDLVAYIENAGRARELGVAGRRCGGARGHTHDHMTELRFSAVALNANPARARPHATAPVCAGGRGGQGWPACCGSITAPVGHGPRGAAWRGGEWLRPRPPDWTAREFGGDRLAQALWNGARGTSDAGRGAISRQRSRALAAVVRGFSNVPGEQPARSC